MSTAGTSILAFPGAEGFGANAVGGRGGLVYEVTNTNDAGSGSLRNCIEASGPRICIFKTGGLISLSSPLTIRNPYITIAGQTAPGGGITVRLGTSTEAFSTKTHDVIMRYLTVRPGPGGENHGNQIAASGVELYNIMIDHNTYSWGVDSDIETWYRVTAATIQWSLISEGLNCSTHSKGCHSKGLMIGGYAGSEAKNTIGSANISILHNLMAHNADRNPLMQMCGIAQVVNNVTYNPEFTFSHQQLNCPLSASYINWIGNYHKKGPSSTSNTDLKIIPADSGTWYSGKVYLQGNIGPSRTGDSQPETNWVSIGSGGSSSIIVTTPAVAPAVTTTDAFTAYRDVLADAGNNQGLNCDGTWFSRRDAIDTRIINDVINASGGIIDDPSQVGGWITPASGTPCQDSDHDGMPDVWETLHGLNPSDASDGPADANGDGYTNLEDYLNGTTSTPLSTVTIAGNAGMAGATLTWTDGTPKTAVADGSGNYSLTVPSGWSGTITPSLGCFSFAPLNHSYSNILSDQAAQDFTAAPVANCARIEVKVGGSPMGSYYLLPGEATRVNYAGVNSGPVQVASTNGTKIIAAERDSWWDGTTWSDYAQVMGLPAGQVSDTYVFPAYNNVTLDEQLRFGNVDTGDTTVTVTIGGIFRGSYLLHPSQAVRVNYAGLDSGPVVVQGSPGVKIIAAERDSWWDGAKWSSYAQLMGLPASQVTDTYVFPAYNNVTLDEQLRFGNVDTVDTTVTVTIGGIFRGSYLLHPSEAVRVNYAGVDSGPVVVQGTPNVKIIAAERDSWWDGTTWSDYNQLMGLPVGQVADKYVFSAYSNTTVDEQLRFGNVDTVDTTVTVTIGGIFRGSYLLHPSQAVRVNYAGVDSGPVVVQGTPGVKIIAAERDSWWDGKTWSSFVQMMGLPSSLLSDSYVFPAYNNVTLDEQLRFGVP